MKTTVRLLVLLLALVLAVGCFASCGNKNGNGTESGTANGTGEGTTSGSDGSEEQTDSLKPDLEAIDYGGYEFRILTHNDEQFLAEDYIGTPINDAVYARNIYLEEKYQILLQVDTCAENGYLNKVEAATMGGVENQYDLVNAAVSYAYQLAYNGYLREVSEYPHVNFEKPYWWKNVLDDTSIDHKNYFTINDACLRSFYQMSCIMFNKTIAKNNQMPDFFAMVDDGSWTLDEVIRFSKDAYFDATGDGYTLDDTFGSTGNSYMTDCLIYGWDMLFVPKNDLDIPELAVSTNQKFLDAFDKVTAFFNDPTTLYGEGNLAKSSGKSNYRQTVPQPTFEEGRCLFWIESLGWVEYLRGLDNLDFGLLPVPKVDEEQKTYTNCMHAWTSSGISVLKTVTDMDRTGRILEDMAYSSSQYVRPAYYEIMIVGHTIRDEDSYRMLPYILNNIRVDLAMVFRQSGFTLVDDLRALATNNRPSSQLQRSMNAYKIILERITDKMVPAAEETTA